MNSRRKGNHVRGKEAERLASWKAARPTKPGLQTAANFQLICLWGPNMASRRSSRLPNQT